MPIETLNKLQTALKKITHNELSDKIYSFPIPGKLFDKIQSLRVNRDTDIGTEHSDYVYFGPNPDVIKSEGLWVKKVVTPDVNEFEAQIRLEQDNNAPELEKSFSAASAPSLRQTEQILDTLQDNPHMSSLFRNNTKHGDPQPKIPGVLIHFASCQGDTRPNGTCTETSDEAIKEANKTSPDKALLYTVRTGPFPDKLTVR